MTACIIGILSLVISFSTLLYVLWTVHQTHQNLAELHKRREENTKTLLKSYDEIAKLRSELGKHEQVG